MLLASADRANRNDNSEFIIRIQDLTKIFPQSLEAIKFQDEHPPPDR
jgi:hypothetical protein